MLRPRIFPCLLLRGESLVKTVQFQNPTYIGDALNAVRIFNAKKADELLLLDIAASQESRGLNISLIQKIADECFMPLTVGGGIKSLKDIEALLKAGVEKVSINSQAIGQFDFIAQAVKTFGSQAIVVSMDVKRNGVGYEIFTSCGKKPTGFSPLEFARRVEASGGGEILVNSIDRDGTMQGYDIELIKMISHAVRIPLIACGGCGKIEDFYAAIYEGGACAAVAGSFFVFQGKRRAVLINFPTREELQAPLTQS